MATLPTPGGDEGTWGDELNEFLRVAHEEDGTINAENIAVADTNGDYTASDVEGVLAEIAPQLGGGGLYDAFAYLREEQTQNTQGGTPTTAGSFGTRVLNTEVYDPDGIVSLSSNQFTLQAGTYLIKARAPFYQCGRTVLRLRNVTDSSTVINGSGIFSTDGGNDQTHAFLTARFTIAGSKAFELQYVVGNTGGGSRGLGVELNYSGITEVYSEVEIWREA